MDAVQITTIIVLVALAASITVVTFYLVQLLRELKTTVKDADKAIKDIGKITGAVGGPVAIVAGVLENVAKGTKAFRALSSIFSKNEEE